MMRVFFGMKRDNFVITKKLLNIQSLKVKLSYLLTKILRSDYCLNKKGILYCGSRIMNKKKYTKAEQKRAWDCYVCRLTSPIEIHRPTKEEKEMLKKAGYIIK